MNPFRRNPSAIALAVLAVTALVAGVWANQTLAGGVRGYSETPTDEQLAEIALMQLLQMIPGPTIPVAVLAVIALCLVGAVTASGGRLGTGVRERRRVSDRLER
ncbi:hypothetical protein J7E25_13390 [Agromyces sp. ISL-38]|uniref:hypothetical protein n=1 Tax=Agromyces sp. ISL-38 TaxID=2819107 RepID=UPI001BEBC920|nr:hypothetical protein [Agromyces sp. ISL-38]MBT2500080.1 hypothetical protein [Agromyces sp. ISL-38]